MPQKPLDGVREYAMQRSCPLVGRLLPASGEEESFRGSRGLFQKAALSPPAGGEIPLPFPCLLHFPSFCLSDLGGRRLI